MHALRIFILTITVFLFVDTFPCVQSKVYTIPLKKKSTISRRARKLGRRALKNMEILDQSPDVAYFGVVTLGGSQNFDVQFDTGSADFFVPSIDCNSDACLDKVLYDRNQDEHFVDLGEQFSVNYVRGSAKGISGTTTFEIEELLVDTQRFGLVDNLSPEFENDDYDGVLGMGLSSASVNNQITPISNLISQNALDNPQFSFLFGRSVDQSASELTIGGTNQERYLEPITWTGLTDNNQGLWKIPLQNFFVGGQPLDFPNRDGVIDTGASLITVPPEDARQIYSKIPDTNEENGRFRIPCTSQVAISLQISGVTYDVDPRDFIVKDDEEVDECFGAIEGRDIGPDTEWVVGITFLKNVYSIFDQGEIRVGFAKLKTA